MFKDTLRKYDLILAKIKFVIITMRFNVWITTIIINTVIKIIIVIIIIMIVIIILIEN